MMLPKDEILLQIESLALSGEGVAKKEGLVFFVDGALPGEEVRAEVTKTERNLIRAKTLEVFKKSSARVDVPCEHFGYCGGCAFQHLAYEEQLKAKQKALEDLFCHLGGFKNVQVEPIVPSPKPYHYRNTLSLTVRHRNDEPLFGFIGKDNHSFIPIEQCPVAEERINHALPAIRKKFKEVVPEKKRRHTSQVAIRLGMGGEIYTSFKSDEGSQVMSAQVAGKKFKFSGASFFQINYSILEDFVRTVREFLEPDPTLDLLDLYCGVGLFALCLSESYRNVLGIEESEQAVSHARESASANQILNTRFISGRAEDALARSHEFLKEVSHVVADPPRLGMNKEVTEELLRMEEIKKIVYVSCDPGTLIRDLKLLAPGFVIKAVRPFDMFPQTAHLETAVLLTRI